MIETFSSRRRQLVVIQNHCQLIQMLFALARLPFRKTLNRVFSYILRSPVNACLVLVFTIYTRHVSDVSNFFIYLSVGIEK